MINDAVDILKVYLASNQVPPDAVAKLLKDIHSALISLGNESADEPTTSITGKPKPAVPIKDSVTDDYICCLEDGRKMKILKRHIQQDHNMTPEAYRTKWELPESYPMTAKNYSKQRSGLAKKQGLGNLPGRHEGATSAASKS